jgi:cation transport regulator
LIARNALPRLLVQNAFVWSGRFRARIRQCRKKCHLNRALWRATSGDFALILSDFALSSPADSLRRMTSMPYNSIGELPPSVGNHLPIHAQEIYRAAFNNAWEEYADRGRVREQIAHRVAWAAVKRLYVKQRDEWIPRA